MVSERTRHTFQALMVGHPADIDAVYLLHDDFEVRTHLKRLM